MNTLSADTIAHQADADAVDLSERRIENSLKSGATDSPGRVVVAYFTPRDRAPANNHTERIRRIVEEAATFYGRELNRHGFSDRQMSVLRDDDGEVEVIDVVGKDDDKDYGKPDGRRIREETVAVLRARKIDPQKIVLLLFCNLMDYDPVQSKISHHSPYYGGGSHLSGTAWQCDSEILDPLRFRDSTPILDGEYGRITIGRHNSIFIGGVIHELGHALSLPHCRQRKDESVRGTALMGSGNRTYAQQLRKEGRGTFLTQAHAMRLAAHPVFNERVGQSLYDQPKTDWSDVDIKTGSLGSIQIEGRVSATVPIHALIAYFDPEGGGDYDATTATAVPGSEGEFAMRSGALRKDKSAELRLVACHVNGSTSTQKFAYSVDSDGRVDLSKIRIARDLAPVLDALRRSSLVEAKRERKRLAHDDESLRTIGQRVLDRFERRELSRSIDPNSNSSDATSIPLTRLTPSTAQVGWIRPTYDAVPEKQSLLSIDGDFFATGIYAHAPAKHEYQIDGAWKRLTGQCGLQSGHPGKVNFEVLGDGKMLWQSETIAPGPGNHFDIDITGIKTLSLRVGDGGNGTGADWGVWIEPQLTR
ncbi:MAG: NPCBM/NEW2 domain-containing protein [Rubripirellula sp.]